MLSVRSLVARPLPGGAVLLVLLGAACARSTPATDSVAASPPALDSAAAPIAPPSAVVDSTLVATPPSTPTAPAAPVRPSTSNAAPVESTPPRSRPTPRPPRPVPQPMPGRGLPPLQPDDGGDQASDQVVLDRLRREVRALVHTDGCASVGQCAVQAIGERACGGPSEYLVYCPKSTDVAALQRKAAEIARADKAFNAKYDMASTCMYQMPPKAELAGGSCRAAAAGGGAPGAGVRR